MATNFDYGVFIGVAAAVTVKVGEAVLSRVLPRMIITLATWTGQDLLKTYIEHHFGGKHV